MLNNLDFLLNQDWAEDFFAKKYSGVRVLEIQRSKTFNTASFNILYTLLIGEAKKFVRLSASTQADRKPNYEVLRYLFENGFNEGEVLVPHPISYEPEISAYLYEDVPGHTFMHDLGQPAEKLAKNVGQIGRGLKKFHSVPVPEIEGWPLDWGLNVKAMAEYYPKLTAQIENLRAAMLKEISNDSVQVLCHGDFQPNNLVFYSEKLYILDLGSVCKIDPELDIASFVLQLKIMLKKYGDLSLYENLKNEFTTSYGEFNLRKMQLYSTLLSFRILDYFIVFPESENNRDRIPFGHELVRENLRALSIDIDV